MSESAYSILRDCTDRGQICLAMPLPDCAIHMVAFEVPACSPLLREDIHGHIRAGIIAQLMLNCVRERERRRE